MHFNTFILALAASFTTTLAATAPVTQSCTWAPIQNKPSTLNCAVQGTVKNPQTRSTWTVKGGSFTDCRQTCYNDSGCIYYSFNTSSSQCKTYAGTISGSGFTSGNTGTTYWNRACYIATCTSALDVSSLSYSDGILQAHNIHRANHSVPNLTWSTTMVNYAQQIASTCVYAHSRAAGDGNYGQNIGAGSLPSQVAGQISNNMYNGEFSYYPKPYGVDSPDMSNFEAWGHYSQIVWASTTQVGCATQYCPNGLNNTSGNIRPYFTVCNYYPPGNYIGEFSQVKAPLGGATVTVSPHI